LGGEKRRRRLVVSLMKVVEGKVPREFCHKKRFKKKEEEKTAIPAAKGRYL